MPYSNWHTASTSAKAARSAGGERRLGVVAAHQQLGWREVEGGVVAGRDAVPEEAVALDRDRQVEHARARGRPGGSR